MIRFFFHISNLTFYKEILYLYENVLKIAYFNRTPMIIIKKLAMHFFWSRLIRNWISITLIVFLTPTKIRFFETSFDRLPISPMKRLLKIIEKWYIPSYPPNNYKKKIEGLYTLSKFRTFLHILWCRLFYLY